MKNRIHIKMMTAFVAGVVIASSTVVQAAVSARQPALYIYGNALQNENGNMPTVQVNGTPLNYTGNQETTYPANVVLSVPANNPQDIANITPTSFSINTLPTSTVYFVYFDNSLGGGDCGRNHLLLAITFYESSKPAPNGYQYTTTLQPTSSCVHPAANPVTFNSCYPNGCYGPGTAATYNFYYNAAAIGLVPNSKKSK